MRFPGFFITFEGPEGSGKSTQVRLLKAWLVSRGIPVVDTFEPGGSRLGASMRRWLLKPGHGLTVESELLLFLADRSQHVAEVILPALRKGFVVICDRYTDSTLAYQGGGRGWPIPLLDRLNRLATGNLIPDLTLLLDVPVKTGLRRARKGSAGDRIERERQAFHRRVRSAFLRMARRQRRRFVVLDGLRPIGDVSLRVKDAVLGRLPAALKQRTL